MEKSHVSISSRRSPLAKHLLEVPGQRPENPARIEIQRPRVLQAVPAASRQLGDHGLQEGPERQGLRQRLRLLPHARAGQEAEQRKKTGDRETDRRRDRAGRRGHAALLPGRGQPAGQGSRGQGAFGPRPARRNASCSPSCPIRSGTRGRRSSRSSATAAASCCSKRSANFWPTPTSRSGCNCSRPWPSSTANRSRLRAQIDPGPPHAGAPGSQAKYWRRSDRRPARSCRISLADLQEIRAALLQRESDFRGALIVQVDAALGVEALDLAARGEDAVAHEEIDQRLRRSARARTSASSGVSLFGRP